MKYVASGKCFGAAGARVDADSVTCFREDSSHVRTVEPLAVTPGAGLGIPETALRLVELWSCDCGLTGVTYTDTGDRRTWLAYSFETQGERLRTITRLVRCS